MLPGIKPSRSDKAKNPQLKINTSQDDDAVNLQFPKFYSSSRSMQQVDGIESPTISNLEGLLYRDGPHFDKNQRSVSSSHIPKSPTLTAENPNSLGGSSRSVVNIKQLGSDSTKLPSSPFFSSYYYGQRDVSSSSLQLFPGNPLFYSEYDNKIKNYPYDPSNFMRRKSILNNLSKSSSNSSSRFLNINHELCKKG
ncbi:hypothetical protein AYI68_g4718 [Smittium mucronatum]|uniref:Uncharacterized protein n=1 Tax=Smittium mucronatum TaxID=133383 RepID=A0A1R0GWB1_9FUNG|nr:hypothetical protein AYI68_g4718 [Smittium mucronatum]